MKATGIDKIGKERSEHFTKHNRTIESDIIDNADGQLVLAARLLLADDYLAPAPEGWDFSIWNHMRTKDWVKKLAIAGSLIAAEIDRIQEIEKQKP